MGVLIYLTAFPTVFEFGRAGLGGTSRKSAFELLVSE